MLLTHWSQYIDYWAVDWNYRDDTFHNEWQAYRTKKNPNMNYQLQIFMKKKVNTVL